MPAYAPGQGRKFSGCILLLAREYTVSMCRPFFNVFAAALWVAGPYTILIRCCGAKVGFWAKIRTVRILCRQDAEGYARGTVPLDCRASPPPNAVQVKLIRRWSSPAGAVPSGQRRMVRARVETTEDVGTACTRIRMEGRRGARTGCKTAENSVRVKDDHMSAFSNVRRLTCRCTGRGGAVRARPHAGIHL